MVRGPRQIAALAALLAAGVLGAPRDARAYSALAHEAIIDAAWDAQRGRLQLENRNFDTGRAVRAGDYTLVDETYADLVHHLASLQAKGASAPPPMIADIKAFYANTNAPVETQKHKEEWSRLLRELERLR